jgi:hypothetical protein
MSRIPRRPTAQAQLDLFTPRPPVPRWSNLPRTVRQTIKAHLATLIRQHAARLRNRKEADDER